jgi:hypothetical protein
MADWATHWVAYGQVQPVYNAAIDDPPCNLNGTLGEVASLPYTVPAGKVLVVEAYGIEAYGKVAGGPDGGGLVLVPWIGELPATNAKCLMSCYSDNASNEVLGSRFVLPAGKKLHARVMCSENPASVCGWYIRGRLEDVA